MPTGPLHHGCRATHSITAQVTAGSLGAYVSDFRWEDVVQQN
ncbi:MAG: hypothetical protein AB8B58_12620 [Roseobacter sp.]